MSSLDGISNVPWVRNSMFRSSQFLEPVKSSTHWRIKLNPGKKLTKILNGQRVTRPIHLNKNLRAENSTSLFDGTISGLVG